MDEAYPGWLEGLKAVFAPLLEPRILAPVSAGVLVFGLFLGAVDFKGHDAGAVNGRMADTGQRAVSETVLVPTAGASGFLFMKPNATAPQIALVQPDSRQEMMALSNLMANSSLLGRVRLNPSLTPPALSPTYGRGQLVSPYETVAVSPGGARAQSDSSAIERSRQPSAEEWLVRIRQDPSGFAGRLASRSLAEQELWVDNLARVASQNNQLGEVVASLRSSPSRGARLLADDFEAVGRDPQFR